MGNYNVPSTLKRKRYYSTSTPDYGKNEGYPSHNHSDHPFYLSPFHHLNLWTGLTIPVGTLVHVSSGRRCEGWDSGSGNGKEREMDSIKTWPKMASSHVTVGFYISFTHPNFFLRYAILRTLCQFNSFLLSSIHLNSSFSFFLLSYSRYTVMHEF